MHGQAFDIGNFHGAPVSTIVLLAERVAAKLYSAADDAAARGRGLQECRAPHLIRHTNLRVAATRKLFWRDHDLTLIALALDPDAVQPAQLGHVVRNIRAPLTQPAVGGDHQP